MANAGADTNGSQFFINQNPADQSSQLSSDSYPKAIIDAYTKGGNPSLDKTILYLDKLSMVWMLLMLSLK